MAYESHDHGPVITAPCLQHDAPYVDPESHGEPGEDEEEDGNGHDLASAFHAGCLSRESALLCLLSNSSGKMRLG